MGPHQQADEFNNRVFQNLLDSFADQYAPVTGRLQKLLNERGWTHLQRTSH